MRSVAASVSLIGLVCAVYGLDVHPESVEGVALQGTGHAAGAAAAATELEAGDGEHLDAGVPQTLVSVDVALVSDHHAGLDGEQVVAIVPLLARGQQLIAAGLEGADARHVQYAGQGGE